MDCKLVKYQNDLAEINASYKQYPPSPKSPLFMRGAKGIILHVLLHLGIAALCVTPGIVLFSVSNGNINFIYTGIVVFLVGSFIMILIVSYIENIEKKLINNRRLYWEEKTKILLWNVKLDHKKKQIIEDMSTYNLKENIIPSAPILEESTVFDEIPHAHITPSAPNESDISLEITEETNECHHCFETFGKRDAIFTYNCCKCFRAHYQCLVAWAELSIHCPVCRKNLSENEMMSFLSSIVKVDEIIN